MMTSGFLESSLSLSLSSVDSDDSVLGCSVLGSAGVALGLRAGSPDSGAS